MNNPDSGAALEELLPVTEVSRLLRLSKWGIYDRIDSGELPAIRIGHGPRAPIRIRASDVEKLLVPVVPKNLRRNKSDEVGGAP